MTQEWVDEKIKTLEYLNKKMKDLLKDLAKATRLSTKVVKELKFKIQLKDDLLMKRLSQVEHLFEENIILKKDALSTEKSKQSLRVIVDDLAKSLDVKNEEKKS